MNAYVSMLREKKLALIVSLPENHPALCQAAFESGADAVKVHINVGHRASGTAFGRLEAERPALEEMLAHRCGPMGLMLGGSLEQTALDAKAAEELTFSFYSVYAHHLPAWAMKSDRAWMAACASDYTLPEIAAMPTMGVDVLEASVVAGDEYGRPLSLRDLLRYRAITEAVDIPVVVPTQRAIRPEEVELLLRAGVKGIMIGAVVTGKEEKSIARTVQAFRRAIDAL